MAEYLARTISRAFNQLLLLFGGVLLLAFLLCAVAGQIRSAGSSVFGNGYYYFVAPGIVCHETGHALGCLLTGTKILHFEPFKPNGNQLGYVVIERRDGNPLWRAGEFLIGLGPVWFGCVVIWILTRIFFRNRVLPVLETSCSSGVFSSGALVSSRKYWFRVLGAAWLMFKSVFKIWKLRSTASIVYLYLVFCIASEMGLSGEDLRNMLFGFACVCIVFLVLNIVPAVGTALNKCVFFVSEKMFPVHVMMMFVLIVDFLFTVLLVWPTSFLR
jgi:hypothetical protein